VLIPEDIDLNELDQNSMIKTKGYQGIDSNIYYQTHTNGYTKILTISDKSMAKQDKENEDHTPTTINV
jgi:hypothetical protein